MTLPTSPGTQALIDLEDAAPDVLFERLPGAPAPLWPQVRSHFMTAMQTLDFGGSPVATPKTRRTDAWRRLAAALLPSGSDARGLRGRRPVVHIVGGTTVHRVDGRVRNWLVGDYLEAHPNRSALLQWADPADAAPAFQPSRSLAPAVTRAAAYARLSGRGRTVSIDPIDRLIREFARLLDLGLPDERLAAITDSATYAEASRPHIEAQLLKVLDRLEPRVVLLEDASYGAWSSLITRLKQRGIRVAEPQHGWIGPTHGAYNFGAAMHTPELAAGLPDELLTFGEYWSSGIRVPSRSVAIGKPHLERMSARARPWAERPNEVLVVSSVTDPEATSDFAVALAEALPDDWRVRFRPHPAERATLATRYPRLLARPRIEIDENHDVYESLASARAVVGVASTVLFEALALGCRVFVRDSPYARYYVGDVFGPLIDGPADVAMLVEGVRDGGGGPSQEFLESVWQPDAVANFGAWLEERLPD